MGDASLCANATFANMLQYVKLSKHTLQKWLSLCFSNPHADSSVSADAYAVLAAVEVGKTAHSHITLHMQSSRRTQDMPRPF